MKEKTTSSDDQLRSEYDFSKMHLVARGIGRTARSTNDSPGGSTSMEEVRVKVTLTNGSDEALVRRGLQTADKIRHYEADIS